MLAPRAAASSALALALALAAPAAAQDGCLKPVLDAPLFPTLAEDGAQGLWVAGTVAPLEYRVARLHDGGWTALPGVFDGRVLALAETTAGLVAGGEFVAVDGVPAAGVARFEAGAWTPLGSGLDAPGEVRAVVEHAGELFVAGEFSSAGGAPVANVARWDGAAWQPLSTGLDGPAEALASFGGLLHVGGAFATAGGVPQSNVVAWDGAGFLPSASNALPPVLDLMVSSGRLHAAANDVFTLDPGATAWARLGSLQLDTSIRARSIAVVDGVVCAVGEWFTFCLTWGGAPCVAGARFERGQWQPLFFDEFQATLSHASAAAFDGSLYVTGVGTSFVNTGLVAFGDGLGIQALGPNDAPWHATVEVTVVGACFEPGRPATVRFGAGPPLPATATSPTQALVMVPAGYHPASGFVDVTIEQGGESAVYPKGFEVLPTLRVNKVVLFDPKLTFEVESLAQAGTAWIGVSADPAPTPLAFPGVHAALLLPAAEAQLLGGGPIHAEPIVSVPFLPGSIPAGTTYRAQALVVETTPNGPVWSFTDAPTIAFP